MHKGSYNLIEKVPIDSVGFGSFFPLELKTIKDI